MNGSEQVLTDTCTLCGHGGISPTPLPGIFKCPHCTALINLRSNNRVEEEKVYLQKPFDTGLDISKTQFEWFDAIMSRDKTDKGKLLDFGCGTGGFLWYASREGWAIDGIELNPDAALKASNRLGQEIFSGSFYEYAGPKSKLDVVTFWDSLDHLLQPDEALARVHTWLSPGGSVLIRVRNASWHYWVRRAQSLLRTFGLLRSRRYVGVIHRYGFTRKSLEQLLLKEGFHEISWQPADFTPKDRYGWVNSLKVKNALLNSYALIARALFRLTGGRVYLFSSLLVRARVKATKP